MTDSLDDLLHTFAEEDRNHSQLKTHYRVAKDDPDTFSNVVDIAERTGLPTQTVENNLAEAQRRADEPDWDDFEKRAPKLSSLMAKDMNFFRQASNKVDRLKNLEGAMAQVHGIKESLGRTFETFTKTLLVDPSIEFTESRARPIKGGTPFTDQGHFDRRTNQFIPYIGDLPARTEFRDQPDSLGKSINVAMRGISESLEINRQESFKTLPRSIQRDRTRPGLTTAKVLDNLGQVPAYAMAMLMPASWVSRSSYLSKLTTADRAILSGMASNSAVIGSQTYVEAEQAAYEMHIAQGMSEDQARFEAGQAARKAANTMRVIAAVTGAFGEGFALANKGLGVKQLTKSAVRGAVAEVPEELAQNALAKAAGGEHLTQAEMGEIAALSAILGGGVNVAMSTANQLLAAQSVEQRDLDQVQRALKEQQIIDDIRENTDDLPPNVTAQALSELNDGVADNIYIDAGVIETLYQDSDLDPESPTAQAIAEQIEDALRVGGDVVLPLSDFLADTRNKQVYEAARPHIRLSPDVLSQSELENSNPDHVNKLIEEANKQTEIKEDADLIYNQVRDQLIKTGRLSSDAAGKSAQIIPAYVTTKAARLGISAKEVFEQMGLRIEGPIDRRQDKKKREETQKLLDRVAELRAKVAGGKAEPEELMSVLDELSEKSFFNPVSGLRNRLAYEEEKNHASASEPSTGEGVFHIGGDEFQLLLGDREISVDADSLKWVNDNMSPESGDILLREIGQALQDTFNVKDPVQGLSEAQKRLDDAIISVEKPNGETIELQGIRLTHGDIGQNKNDADLSLKAEKQRREAEGLRAGRDQQPPQVRRSNRAEPDTEGEQDRGDPLQGSDTLNQAASQEAVFDSGQTKTPELPNTIFDGYKNIQVTPIKKTLYHDTGARNFSLLMTKVYNPPTNQNPGVFDWLFVTDNKELAIGQGGNNGILIEFNGDLVSGTEHDKPGTGDLTGREYITNYINENAINKITVSDDVKLNNFEKRYLRRHFKLQSNDGGEAVYVPTKSFALPKEKKLSQTKTKAFKDWFGDSKVVDENGEPLVVYHGTTFTDITEFLPEGGSESSQEILKFYRDKKSNNEKFGRVVFRKGTFFSPKPEYAGSYTAENTGVMYPVYIKAENPIYFDSGTKQVSGVDPDKTADALILTADGEINEIAVLDPVQVKSAIGNRGTFDPTDPNILAQRDRGQIQFTDEGAIIRLFESSDLSTFLHEAGHLFLRLEASFAQAGKSKDAKVISKWLGADDLTQLTREQEEQWARGFEAYLMEGKAPSIELRDAFSRFRDWLVQIYKNMTRLRVELDDDIRGVFDRLLATDEQIAAANSDLYYDILFDNAESAGMTPKEWDDYLLKQQRAKDKPRATLQEKLLKELRRHTEKKWKDEISQKRAELREILQEQQVYRALSFLKESKSENKMNRDLVKEILGLDAIPPKLRKTTVTQGGLNPDEVAVQFDYTDGKAMLDSILNSPSFTDAVNELAESQMLAEHGDILNDGTLEAKAQEAAHDEERAEVLLAELKALGRRSNAQQIDRGSLKEVAKRVISETKIADIRPFQYHRAEIKAAQKARDALNDGDVIGAHEAKAQQIANFYLWKEATTALEKSESMRRYLDQVKRRKYSPSQVNPEYVRNMKLLLATYDTRKSGRDIDAQAVANWIKAQLETDDVPISVMDPNLRSVMDGGPIRQLKDLTVEELRGLHNQIKHLRYLGGKQSDSVKAKLKRADEEAAVKLLDNFKDKKLPQKGTAAQIVRDAALGFGSQVMLHAETQLRRLDGFTDSGFFYNKIKRPIDDAVNQVLYPRQVKEGEAMVELFDRFYSKDEQKAMAKTNNVRGHVLTRWEMVTMALNQGNESSKLAVKESKSGGQEIYQEGDIEAILDKLEKRDWDFVQAVWDYVDTFWPELSALERERTGIVPSKVEASEVDTKFGKYRGGYFPLKYDTQQDLRVTEEQYSEMINSITLGRFSKAATKDGMLQERKGSGGRPVRLDIGVLHQHVNEVVTLLAFSKPISEVQTVLNGKNFREAMQATGNDEVWKALDVWLKDTAAGEIIGSSKTSRVLRHLRAGFSASKIGWNIGTILVQPLGLAQSMPVIGYRNVWTGLKALAANPVGKNSVIRKVQSTSSFMHDRGTTFNKDIRDAMATIRGSRFLPSFVPDWAVDSLFAGIVFTQRFVDVATWLGAYEQGKQQGIEKESDLVNFADRAVARSQASGIWSDRTPVERGTIDFMTRQSEFVRMWTALGSYFFAKGNVAYEQFAKTNFKSPHEAFRFAVDVMMLFTVEAIIVGLMRGMWPDGDDEDYKAGISEAKFIAGETVGSMAASIPFLRDIGSEFAGFRGGSVLSQFYKEMGEAKTQIAQGELDMALFKSINDVGGMLFKYPSGQLNRVTDSLVKDIQGEDVDPVDYLIWREK